jgi:hypothetical protein
LAIVSDASTCGVRYNPLNRMEAEKQFLIFTCKHFQERAALFKGEEA